MPSRGAFPKSIVNYDRKLGYIIQQYVFLETINEHSQKASQN